MSEKYIVRKPFVLLGESYEAGQEFIPPSDLERDKDYEAWYEETRSSTRKTSFVMPVAFRQWVRTRNPVTKAWERTAATMHLLPLEVKTVRSRPPAKKAAAEE